MVPKGAVGYHYHNGPLGMDFRVSDLSSYQIEAPAGILKDNSLWGASANYKWEGGGPDT